MRKLLIILLIFLNSATYLYSQSTKPILIINTEMHSKEITSISTDHAGNYILTSSLDKTAKLWDAQTGKVIRTFRIPIGEGSEGLLYAASINPTGDIVALGGFTGNQWDDSFCIYIFEVETGKLLKRITDLPGVILDLEFSPVGNYLAAAIGDYNGVTIFKTDTWDIKKKLNDFNENCNKIAWDYTGRIGIVTNDGQLKLYSSAFELINKIKTKSGKRPSYLTFSPDRSKIAVSFKDVPEIDVYEGFSLSHLYSPDISGLRKRRILERNRWWVGSLNKLTFSADSKYLVGGGSYYKYDFKILLWVGRHWTQIRVWEDAGKGRFNDYKSSNGKITDIKIMADNSIVLSSDKPELTRMSLDGKMYFFKEGEIFDYDNFIGESFNVTYGLSANKNGSEIGIEGLVNQFESPELYFSFSNRQLSSYQNLELHPTKFHKLPGTKEIGVFTINPYNQPNLIMYDTRINFLEQGQRTYCADVSYNKDFVVFGGNGFLTCINKKGLKEWSTWAPSRVTSVKITKNQNVVIAALKDGTIRWYCMEDGKLLLTLYAHVNNESWVLVTPDGYFDCRQGSENLMGWHLNQGPDKEAIFYPVSQFYENFYTPDLGKKVLSGIDFRGTRDLSYMDKFQNIPIVNITSPKNHYISHSEKVLIQVDVSFNQGSTDKIEEIRIFQNDKLVHNTFFEPINRVRKDGFDSYTFPIQLVNGENRIKATAFNKQRIESLPDEVVINYDGNVIEKPNLYILTIGINKYLNPVYNLNYARNDAEAFALSLKKGASYLFEKIEVTTVYDTLATRKGIIAALDTIKSKARQEDVFVFYYAGHGTISTSVKELNPEFYLVPYNVTQLYEASDLLKLKGISAKEIGQISQSIASQKQLFILDACHSGGALKDFAFRGAAEEKAIAQLSRSTGTYFIAASGTEQFATEVATLGHGVFTYSILEALKGACNPQNGRLTVNLLKSCVEYLVPELSKKHKGHPQFPMSYGFGQDFPIVIIR